MKAIFDIDNIHQAIIERTQTTLRDVIGVEYYKMLLKNVKKWLNLSN